ncbi:MAG: ABC transporter permease, partial [Phycisphaeraceae bacterium]
MTLWLWRLVPGNPQVVRIVQGASRRNHHALVRLSYLLILMGVVFIGLVAGGGLTGSGDLRELAQAGSQIFRFVAMGQVVLVCLIAPIFMAGAIASEQSGKTYAILLTTPLSNLQIVLGSLIGRLFFILALLFSGLPLFAVMLIFGGVPVSSIFVAFSVAALTALFVGAVAVVLSVMRAGGRKAVFAFVVSIAAYLVV